MPEQTPEVAELAKALREALTQWTIEPLNASRDSAGLTRWAGETMNRAGELCEELGAKSPFYN